MLKLTDKQSGVTMIELLIAITIMSLLMVTGVPSFILWIQNSQTRTASESIQNGLQLARAEAVRRNVAARLELCGLPNSSWQIIALSPTSPAPAQSLACAAAVSVAGEERIQERSSQEGSSSSTVSTVPVGATRVTFNSLGRVVSNADGSASITQINVSNPRGDRPLRISISTGGSIRMCNPALANTDPQGCLP